MEIAFKGEGLKGVQNVLFDTKKRKSLGKFTCKEDPPEHLRTIIDNIYQNYRKESDQIVFPKPQNMMNSKNMPDYCVGTDVGIEELIKRGVSGDVGFCSEPKNADSKPQCCEHTVGDRQIVRLDKISFVFKQGDIYVRIYDNNDGKEIGHIYLFRDGAIVSTIEGYFTGTGNFLQYVNFINGVDLIDANRLYDVFFRPDLVTLKLNGEDISPYTNDLTVQQALKSPPPKIMFTQIKSTDNETLMINGEKPEEPFQTTNKNIRLFFDVEDNQGGIGVIRVYHGGKLIKQYGDAAIAKTEMRVSHDTDNEYRLAKTNRKKRGTVLYWKNTRTRNEIIPVIDVDFNQSSLNKTGVYSLDVELTSGYNELSVEAFNASNTFVSLRDSIVVYAKIKTKSPKLYAVVVGIKDFKDKRSNLKYTVNDSKAVKRVLRQKSACKNKKIAYMENKDATGKAILNAIDQIAKEAGVGDTVLLYMATHGLADNDDFYLMPYDNEHREDYIRFADLFKQSSRIKALYQVFIFDTCQAGAALDIASLVYDAKSSVLAKQSGIHLLSATTSTRGAYGNDELKHGVFTYNILKTLEGTAADVDSDNFISVKELSGFLRNSFTASDLQRPVIRKIGRAHV